MRDVTVQVYKFEELSPKVQERVLAKFREFVTMEMWYQFVFDDLKEQGKERGFTVEDINFSGFSSQGDGARWTGTIDVVPWLKRNAPDSLLLAHVEDIQEYANYVRITASRSQYCHENTMEIVHDFDALAAVLGGKDPIAEKACDDLAQEMLKDAKSFAQDCYKALETEYEYETSDEVIKENIEVNEYEFHADGRIYAGDKA